MYRDESSELTWTHDRWTAAYGSPTDDGHARTLLRTRHHTESQRELPSYRRAGRQSLAPGGKWIRPTSQGGGRGWVLLRLADFRLGV